MPPDRAGNITVAKWRMHLLSMLVFIVLGVICCAAEIVVVMQLQPIVATIANQLSQLHAYQYAKANGYPYHLIEMSLSSEYEKWHTSWKTIDAVRQILLNHTIDYVLFVGPLTLLRDEFSIQELLLEGNDIFLSTNLQDNLEMISDGNCIDGPLSIQLWRNSPFSHEVLKHWMTCVDDLETDCSTYQFSTPPYTLGVLFDILYPRFPLSRSISSIDCDQFISLTELDSNTSPCSVLRDEITDGTIASPIHRYVSTPISAVLYKHLHQIYEDEVLVHHRTLQVFRDGFCLPILFPVKVPILRVDSSTPESPPIVVRTVEVILKAYFSAQTSIESCMNDFQLTIDDCHYLFDQLNALILQRRKDIIECQGKQFLASTTQRKRSYDAQKAALFHDAKFLPQPRVIVTIFAGRYDRLSVNMKYWQVALTEGIVHEVHIWDYCRNASDRMQVMSLVMQDPRIRLKTKYTNRNYWVDYYEYYYEYSIQYPKDIIIKCDDDIVFVDVKMLPRYIQAIAKNESFAGLLLPNIVNNGVIAHLQQSVFNILPTTLPNGEPFEMEYPPDGLGGRLWENATKARLLHEYFLSNWRTILPPKPAKLPLQPTILPVTSRISINFFAIRADQWYRIRDVGNDDELHLTVTLVTAAGLLSNAIFSNLFVSHLSFGPQSNHPEEFNISAMIEKYNKLYQDYMKECKYLIMGGSKHSTEFALHPTILRN